jgi:hypothetical protein
MQIASGRVVDGRMELDAQLPEGASVTVIAADRDETFEVDAATEKKLLDAIAEGDRSDVIPLNRLISEMRRRE